jgi:hypothetical protein
MILGVFTTPMDSWKSKPLVLYRWREMNGQRDNTWINGWLVGWMYDSGVLAASKRVDADEEMRGVVGLVGAAALYVPVVESPCMSLLAQHMHYWVHPCTGGEAYIRGMIAGE